jgi:hypothetical protein
VLGGYLIVLIKHQFQFYKYFRIKEPPTISKTPQRICGFHGRTSKELIVIKTVIFLLIQNLRTMVIYQKSVLCFFEMCGYEPIETP